MMVVQVVVFPAINGKTIDDPYRYQGSADEESTTAGRPNFVPSSNTEEYMLPLWLIKAGKAIYNK